MLTLILIALIGRDDPFFDRFIAAWQDSDAQELAQFLQPGLDIDLDLRPLLPDHGRVSGRQVDLAFRRLSNRFEIRQVMILSDSGDTNYAHVECVLRVTIRDMNGTLFNAFFDLRFRVHAYNLGLSYWHLQRLE